MPQTKSAERKPKAPAAKTLNMIVETPRGSRNKYKFDERRKRFRLNSVLPAGSEFPYDFGYVPKTCARGAKSNGTC